MHTSKKCEGSVEQKKIMLPQYLIKPLLITIHNDDSNGWKTMACYVGQSQKIRIVSFNERPFLTVMVTSHFLLFFSLYWSIISKLFMQGIRVRNDMSIIVQWETLFSPLEKQCQESISIY